MSWWATGIFLYDLLMIVVLAAFGFAYVEHQTVQAWIPDLIRLPVHCMWFGALGGIVISLKGVYDHATTAAPNPWPTAIISGTLADPSVAQ